MSEPSHLITGKSYLAPLEGWRGAAALCVVSFHFSKLFFYEEWTPMGYLGVDFFFILSGFIIARQYEADIALHTISFKTFAIRRIARLYPLYIISIGASVIIHSYLVLPLIKFNDMDFGMGPEFVYRVFLQITMLNKLTVMPQPNGPVWSVSVEWIVNLAFFALVWHFRRVPTALLWCLVALGALYTISMSPHLLDEPGHNIPIVRGVVGFTLGSLIFRYHERLPEVPVLYLFLFEMALTALAGTLVYLHDYPFVITDDYVFELLIFPLVIIVCLYRQSLIGWLFSLWQFRFLGRISYSIYLLHHPLAFFMEFTPSIHALGHPWLGGYYIMTLIALSTITYLVIEMPGRWLGRKLTR